MEGKKKLPKEEPRFTKEELLALALEDAIAISDRFAREPVLSRTGKGHYLSAGAEGLKEDMAYLKSLGSDGKPR